MKKWSIKSVYYPPLTKEKDWSVEDSVKKVDKGWVKTEEGTLGSLFDCNKGTEIRRKISSTKGYYDSSTQNKKYQNRKVTVEGDECRSWMRRG